MSLPHLATITDTPTAVFGHDLSDIGPSLASDLEHFYPLDWTAEIFIPDTSRWAAMARLVNAWVFHEGYGMGAENPHLIKEQHAGPDFRLLIVQGISTGEFFVVKCRQEFVGAKEYNARHLNVGVKRSVRRKTAFNPDHQTRYEIPWRWLEPEEMHEAGLSVDDAEDMLLRWGSELANAWTMEAEGRGNGNEIEAGEGARSSSRPRAEVLCDPLLLPAAAAVDDGQAVLDEVLDRVMAWEQLGADAGEM